jgi:hypothetical protein
MKTDKKTFLTAPLLFAIIFFVVYLLILVASFFGCCTGITTLFYSNIVWLLFGIGAITFAFCLNNTCNEDGINSEYYPHHKQSIK